MTEIPQITARQQIEANIQHVNNQRATFILQLREAENAAKMIQPLTLSIAQTDAAIAAYQETLKLLPPDPVALIAYRPAPETNGEPPAPAAPET